MRNCPAPTSKRRSRPGGQITGGCETRPRPTTQGRRSAIQSLSSGCDFLVMPLPVTRAGAESNLAGPVSAIDPDPAAAYDLVEFNRHTQRRSAHLIAIHAISQPTDAEKASDSRARRVASRGQCLPNGAETGFPAAARKRTRSAFAGRYDSSATIAGRGPTATCFAAASRTRSRPSIIRTQPGFRPGSRPGRRSDRPVGKGIPGWTRQLSSGPARRGQAEFRQRAERPVKQQSRRPL